MASLADLSTELPEWVSAIASQLDNTELSRISRVLAKDLKNENRKRIRSQTDPDGNDFVKPLQAKNSPMFRELTRARYMKHRARGTIAEFGFASNAGRIAIIHHEGRRSKVRADSSKKYPYPERRLLGFSDSDKRLIISTLRNQLAGD